VSVEQAPIPMSRLTVQAISISGSPMLISAGERRSLEVGSPVRLGDVVSTDASSWVELAVGESPDPASSSIAIIRLLPGTTFSLRRLSDLLDADEPRIVELGVDEGSITVKVGKQSGRNEFFVVSPKSALSVRGTAFAFEEHADFSRIAVRQGSVAVLPKGPLLSGLIDGRTANPVAGAVVRTAFAFAPTVRAGQEFSLGTAAMEASEAAYGALLVAAERAQSDNIVLEEVEDPTSVIASAGSDAERKLRAALSAYRSAAISSASKTLSILDSMRNPTLGYEPYTVSSPVERAEAPSAPRAILWVKKVSGRPIFDALTRVGAYVVGMDSGGFVFVLDAAGELKWSSKLGSLALTAFGQSLAVASATEVLVLDGETGRESGRFSFGFPAASSYAKPISVPQGLAVATIRGITLLRAENASFIKEILVEGGVVSPPVLVERELACVTGAGSLVFVDPSAGTSSAPIPLSLGASPFSPRYRGGIVAVADRSGRVIVVSVSERRVLWTRDLGVRLGSELEIGDGRVFAWGADKTLRMISISDGSDAVPPIPDVASPPLLSGGVLYWGDSSGSLVIADASTGRVRKRLPIAEASSVRPIMVAGVLYAGTSGGKIVKVDLSR